MLVFIDESGYAGFRQAYPEFKFDKSSAKVRDGFFENIRREYIRAELKYSINMPPDLLKLLACVFTILSAEDAHAIPPADGPTGGPSPIPFA